MRRRVVSAVVLLALACTSAPTIAPNRYGLRVVPDYATYQQLANINPASRMVDVARTVPGVRLDVRYATEDNFMHERLYPIAHVFLREPAARALAAVQRELAAKGLALKVFDGYRPYRVTQRMWEKIGNPDFVADPAKGSRHNRGAAVDVTIVDWATGRELAMPTPYDDFTTRARQDFNDLPADAIANRALLRDVMTRNGFVALPSEWWHFDYARWEQFDLMDVPLEDLDAGD